MKTIREIHDKIFDDDTFGYFRFKKLKLSEDSEGLLLHDISEFVWNMLEDWESEGRCLSKLIKGEYGEDLEGKCILFSFDYVPLLEEFLFDIKEITLDEYNKNQLIGELSLGLSQN